MLAGGGSKRLSIRFEEDDQRGNKIEKRSHEMLLAAVRRRWYKTRGQIVSEVRNHRN